jgi:hypothetical protein
VCLRERITKELRAIPQQAEDVEKVPGWSERARKKLGRDEARKVI